MNTTDRYAGLSGRERSTIGAVVGIALSLAAFAIWHFARGIVADRYRPSVALAIFDVPPPPIPPPEPPPIRVRARLRDIRVRASAPRAAKPGLPHLSSDHPPSLGGPPPIVPVAIAPVITAPLQPVALDTGIGTHGVTGLGESGVAGGDGDGGGDGNGTKPGLSAAVRLTPAAWIRPPSRADFLREWPRNGHGLATAVDVLLFCAVRKNGEPFHCEVRRESLPGKGFGEAAVRLAEHAIVRPVMRGTRRTDMRVIVPLTFALAEARPAIRGRPGASVVAKAAVSDPPESPVPERSPAN